MVFKYFNEDKFKIIDHIPRGLRLGKEYTEGEILAKIDKWGYAYYSMRTTWWSVRSENMNFIDTELKDKIPLNEGLPCDISGSPLMQAEAKHFIKVAKEKSNHYGKHGFRTFLAAYHGCIQMLINNNMWVPIALSEWNTINLLIDKRDILIKRQEEIEDSKFPQPD